MPTLLLIFCSLMFISAASIGEISDSTIKIEADKTVCRLSHLMTGVCIEDVNHEIYGGLYSQMVFGESFQEPPAPLPIDGFQSYGAGWTVSEDGILHGYRGDGPKLVKDNLTLLDGSVSVDLKFDSADTGNSGLILRVSDPGVGADKWTGYEVSLEPSRKMLVIGRHRQNWEPLKEVPCNVPINEWINLRVQLNGAKMALSVNNEHIADYVDSAHPLTAGSVGMRVWQRNALFRNLIVTSNNNVIPCPFISANNVQDVVSGMWRGIRTGNALGTFELTNSDPFVGVQSQKITYKSGSGEIGVSNMGLNHWGMCWRKGKPYDIRIHTRSKADIEIDVALQNEDGRFTYAAKKCKVKRAGWQLVQLTLSPSKEDVKGRLAISLTKPGSITLGYVRVQPDNWGLFKGLPVRKDVAESMAKLGLTVVRYGGSLVNAPAYRWKKMVGPRDNRQPYLGTWYPYTSNGWGIPDFLAFCDAAGFVSIPAFNMDETPADMADFMDYATGSTDTEWGRKRVSDGFKEPFNLKYVELGNEESVNEDYWRKFKPLAETIWAKSPDITIVVGDFAYNKPITDPYHFDGAPTITSLATHKKILELARDHNRSVWFDVHVWNNDPRDCEGLGGIPSFIHALTTLVPDAMFKIAVFELNANNHAVRRALGNAHAINELERVGDTVRIVCSANGLQPDGQNDNGWDQGLVFLNPAKVWGQPPYYVTQAIANNWLPLCVEATVQNDIGDLDVTAKRDDAGNILQVQVVNLSSRTVPAMLELHGFLPKQPVATVIEISGNLDDVNTSDLPHKILPKEHPWHHGMAANMAQYSFPPNSFTIIRFK